MFVLLILLTTVNPSSGILEIKESHRVDDAVRCISSVMDTVPADPKGFMVLTNMKHELSEASRVQDQIARIAHNSGRTAVMTIDDQAEDQKFYNAPSAVDKETHSSDGDEVGLSQDEDDFIQTHLFFVRLSDLYVIVVDGYRAYKAKIRQVARVPSFNARAPMIIYCSKVLPNRRRMMGYPRHILHSLWSYRVINAVVLLRDFNDRSLINVFSWNPYDPPKRCGEKHQDPLNFIQIYNKCSNGSVVQPARPFFPDKIPKDMMGCGVDVLGVIWHPFLNHNHSGNNKGFDREILDVIAEKINFTVRLHTDIATWGDKNSDGTWTGVFGGLKNGSGEIAMGAIYPDNDVHEDFDATLSYLQDSYEWIVPRAREIPEWENLVIILEPTLWLASIGVYAMTAFVWNVISRSPYENDRLPLPRSLCECLRINLCASAFVNPASDSLRIFFAFFSMYGVIWCTAYQTKMITIFANPSYERQMKSVDEMISAGFEFGGNEAFRQLFENPGDEFFFKNYKKMSIRKSLQRVIDDRNVSVLTTRFYVRYLSAITLHYNDDHGRAMFSVLEPSVFSFPVEMVAVKGFALLPRFDELLALMKSNGLIGLFGQRFAFYAELSAANLARNAGLREHADMQLDLMLLQGAFIGLLLGECVALVAFVAEVLRGKIKNRKE